MIQIYSGPINSGKTTRLMAWVNMQPRSAGILAPVINQKRHLYSIGMNESRILEKTAVDGEPSVSIGRYQFMEKTFQWARDEIMKAIDALEELIVVDEIGPLELAGKGLEPAIKKAVDYARAHPGNRQIWVVRESLVQKVITHYQLESLDILNKETINFS